MLLWSQLILAELELERELRARNAQRNPPSFVLDEQSGLADTLAYHAAAEEEEDVAKFLRDSTEEDGSHMRPHFGLCFLSKLKARAFIKLAGNRPDSARFVVPLHAHPLPRIPRRCALS